MSPDAPALRRYHPGEKILLSGKETRYTVREGSLFVHIAEYSPEGTGRRLPGYPAGPGTVLFGVDTGALSLLADPVEEVLLEESPVLAGTPDAGEILAAMARWIHHPLFTGSTPPHRESRWIPAGSSALAAGEQVQPAIDSAAVLFCRVAEGSVYDGSSDMMFDASAGWFPVLRNTRLVAEGPAVIRLAPFAAVSQEIRLPEALQLLVRWAACRVQERRDSFFLDEETRIYRWLGQEVSIRERIIRKGGADGAGEDPERAVFSRVLAFIGRSGTLPGGPGIAVEDTAARDMGEKIALMADEAGVRVRQVTLPPSWWKEDLGPLLVADAQHALFAALPESPGRYRLYDASGIAAGPGQTGKLPPFTAAWTVYPALPDGECGTGDVVRLIGPILWKRDILALAAFGIISGVLTTAIPVATGLIFGSVIPGTNGGLFLAIVIAAGVTLAASLLFDLYRNYAFLRLYGKAGSVLGAAVMDRVLKLPPRFFRGSRAGDLASRIQDTDRFRLAFFRLLITILFGGSLAVFNIFLMYGISPGLTVPVLAASLVLILLTTVLGWYLAKQERSLLGAQGAFSGLTFQFLRGIAKISSAGAQGRAYLQWDKELRQQIPLKMPAATLRACSMVLASSWSWAVITVVFLVAGLQLATVPGTADSSWFLEYYASLGVFLVALVGLCSALPELFTVIPVWERLQPILSARPETDPGYLHPGTLTGALEVSHVSFRYSPDSPPVLDDISLAVRPGEFVAIVGSSGSGKSTLLRILLGFDRPDAGSVLYDDQDLLRLNIREVRRQIGVVLQDGQLLPGTILENIAGSRSLTPDQAWEAATLAGIDGDIRGMPMQMHTFISEGSTNISGGQRQRILIARAIASRPKILFFDEATSALDNVAQAVVTDSLASLHLTRLVIAHRLSSIRDADRIYVLEDGKIVEEGSFDALMAKGAAFARLARRQMT